MTSKKIIKVAIIGGSNLKVNDKWINTVSLKLQEVKAQEVITNNNGAGAMIGEKSAYNIEVPNVILSGQKMVDRADMLFVLPGGSNTRSYVKMFNDAKKPVVTIVGGE